MVQTINELTNIFKQMAELVYEQGTILDRIDYNIEDALSEAKKANVQLEKVIKKYYFHIFILIVRQTIMIKVTGPEIAS